MRRVTQRSRVKAGGCGGVGGLGGVDWPKLFAPSTRYATGGDTSLLGDIDNAMDQTMRYPLLRGANLSASSSLV